MSGLISFGVLLILPASYSTITLIIEQAHKERDQTVCKEKEFAVRGY